MRIKLDIEIDGQRIYRSMLMRARNLLKLLECVNRDWLWFRLLLAAFIYALLLSSNFTLPILLTTAYFGIAVAFRLESRWSFALGMISIIEIFFIEIFKRAGNIDLYANYAFSFFSIGLFSTVLALDREK